MSRARLRRTVLRSPPKWDSTSWQMGAEGSRSCLVCIDETQAGQKNALLLGPQQFMVQFADRFQLALQLLVVPQPPGHLRALLRTDAELPGVPARVTDRQHPDPMPLPPRTFRTAPFVVQLPLQQGTAQDPGRIRQPRRQPLAGPFDLLVFHLYQ